MEMVAAMVKVALLANIFGMGFAVASPSEYFTAAADKGTYELWLEGRGAAYERSVFLPTSSNPQEGAAVFWSIHDDADEIALSRTSKPWIQFAVVVQASGWVGFGLSEAGGMRGSDMVIWDSQDPTKVRDAHVMEERFPQDDVCSNWDLLKATADDGWIMLEVARNLDTGDSQDLAIMDDSDPFVVGARLISAWGDTTLGYHGSSVAKSEVRLFGEEEQRGVTAEATHKELNATADGSFMILARDFVIPSDQTTYQRTCFTYDDLLEQAPGLAEGQSLTMIGGGPIITPETSQFLHHFIVYGSENSTSCEMSNQLAGWAPGAYGLSLPSNVGIPILGNGQIKSIMLEIHYHNHGGIENQIDSSGYQIYYTLQPREFEGAYLQLGDPVVSLDGTSIGEGLSEWTFECDTMCSTVALGDESVTVLFESLHMHMTGTRMVNELIRDGEIVHTSAVEVFDFDQQGSYRVPMNPYEVNPGDTFRTSCYYRDGKEFGYGSDQEMCSKFGLIRLLCQFVAQVFYPINPVLISLVFSGIFDLLSCKTAVVWRLFHPLAVCSRFPGSVLFRDTHIS